MMGYCVAIRNYVFQFCDLRNTYDPMLKEKINSHNLKYSNSLETLTFSVMFTLSLYYFLYPSGFQK